MTKETKELKLEAEECLIEKIIRLRRYTENVVNSSNIDKIVYDDITKKLVIKFIGGGIYEYSDVQYFTYKDIINGRAATLVSYGGGKYPSVGAAVHQYLIKKGVSYRKLPFFNF